MAANTKVVCWKKMFFKTIVLCVAIFKTEADVLRFQPRSQVIQNGITASNSDFRFANYYGDHMVLQRAPQRAAVWGYAGLNDVGKTVTVELVTPGASKAITKYQAMVSMGPFQNSSVWRIQLKGMEAGGPYEIHATLGQTQIKMVDVMFGDVWLCSGQSNMQFTVTMMLNASEEIHLADQYPNIRLFTANDMQSTEPRYDIDIVQQPWTQANSEQVGHGNWTYFSAVCWLYGRHLYDSLQIPIGLVASDWGGTPVQAWSSPDALRQCPGSMDSHQLIVDKAEERFGGPHNPSVLWNAMIHPLLNFTIYGAIWYQGEDNSRSPTQVSLYGCMFHAMITDWREKFFQATDGQTDPGFPFGFVQLAPNADVSSIGGFPGIRWEQTGLVGYVPNHYMHNVFMAVAIDLPDFHSTYGSIHPRDKSTVGTRLAQAGLAVAYNKNVPFQGPFPQAFIVDRGFFTLEIDYQGLHNKQSPIEVRNVAGFEVCCSSDNTTQCNATVMDGWYPAPVMSHTDTSVTLSYKDHCANMWVMGLRYLWRESPCPYKKCAVYQTDGQLPAPPFIMLGIFGSDARRSKINASKFIPSA